MENQKLIQLQKSYDILIRISRCLREWGELGLFRMMCGKAIIILGLMKKEIELSAIPRKPKIIIAPEGCNRNFTSGKEYNVIDIWNDYIGCYGYGFKIKDDNEIICTCLENACAYLDGGNWIIKEYEDENN